VTSLGLFRVSFPRLRLARSSVGRSHSCACAALERKGSGREGSIDPMVRACGMERTHGIGCGGCDVGAPIPDLKVGLGQGFAAASSHAIRRVAHDGIQHLQTNLPLAIAYLHVHCCACPVPARPWMCARDMGWCYRVGLGLTTS
jgi:hypothetical protein